VEWVVTVRFPWEAEIFFYASPVPRPAPVAHLASYHVGAPSVKLPECGGDSDVLNFLPYQTFSQTRQQFSNNVMQRRVLATIVAAEKPVSTTYSEREREGGGGGEPFVIRLERRMRPVVICGQSGCTVFFDIHINDKIFAKTLLNTKYMF